MPKLDASEVKQVCDFLENDSDQAQMRKDMVGRWAYYSLLDEPDLPEHMTRGDSVSANTPFLGWLTDAIIADVSSYPTFATVIPVPEGSRRPTPAEQGVADRLEKWCNLLLAELDRGKQVTRDMRWHQLNSSYCVPVLRCERPGGDEGELRFRLDMPAPETCFFPISGPGRPKYLARRYSVLARDVEKTYSDRRGAKPGYRPKYTREKRWDWEPVSDDQDPDTVSRATGSASIFEQVEMLYLDDGEYCYHMALNGGKDAGGELMWSEKSHTKGVSAVIVPGRVTPMRGADRFWPGLYPIYQMVKLINRIRAKRETRSDQMRADLVVEKAPEAIKAEADTAGVATASGQAAAAIELETGVNIVEVGGKAVPWSVTEDPDLDKLEQGYWSELRMYADSLRETASAEDMAQATANSYLTWSETKKKQQAPMLDFAASAWREILLMAISAVQEYDEDYELMSDADMEYGRGKKIVSGETVALSAKDLEGFKYVLKVETKSMTEQEIRFRVEDWAQRHALGLATKREGVTAAGYSDEQAQIQALFEERGFELAQPFVEEQVKLAVQDRIRLSSRILVNLGAQPQQPQQLLPAPANPGGNSFSPMQAPLVSGAAGSSDGAVLV